MWCVTGGDGLVIVEGGVPAAAPKSMGRCQPWQASEKEEDRGEGDKLQEGKAEEVEEEEKSEKKQRRKMRRRKKKKKKKRRRRRRKQKKDQLHGMWRCSPATCSTLV